MRTGDCQATGKRKVPCLGSKNTFIWAFYLFFLQALGKYFNWKFSIPEKMHLACADCTTPDLDRNYNHRKHSSVTLLPCYTQVSSPKLFAHTESKDWSQPLSRRTRFLGHGGEELFHVQSCICKAHSAWQNSPSQQSRPMTKLSTMPYLEHKPCSCSSRTKTGLS